MKFYQGFKFKIIEVGSVNYCSKGLKYLKLGAGYPCAGQSMSVVWPYLELEIWPLSATFTFGATLPTGSIVIYQRNM